MRKNFRDDINAREHEMQRNFQLTAKTCGMEVSFFSADPFIHYWLYEAAERLEALENLSRMINKVKPDFVLFDNLCAQQEDTVLTPQVYADTLTQLKTNLEFKLIANYPDAWEPQSFVATQFVANFADIIWSLSYTAYLKSNTQTQEKTLIMPFPHQRSVSDPPPTKNIDAAFLGTSQDYNFLRSLWILSMEDAEIDYELYLTDVMEKPGRLKLTHEEYAELMSRIGTCIQFSARTPEIKHCPALSQILGF